MPQAQKYRPEIPSPATSLIAGAPSFIEIPSRTSSRRRRRRRASISLSFRVGHHSDAVECIAAAAARRQRGWKVAGNPGSPRDKTDRPAGSATSRGAIYSSTACLPPTPRWDAGNLFLPAYSREHFFPVFLGLNEVWSERVLYYDWSVLSDRGNASFFLRFSMNSSFKLPMETS